jgi:large subunit ribosomal protein L3
MAKQKIRIKLKGYDHRLVDQSAQQILEAVESTGAVAVGPVPLPTRIQKFSVIRSPFIDKDSQEQFEIRTHKRLIDIIETTSKTIDALTKLNLPSGVEIDIKLWWQIGLVEDMTEGMIGKKLGMTQVFLEGGRAEAVTAIEAGPCTVVQVKTLARDGYNSAQLGFGEARQQKSSRRGRTKESVKFKHLREFGVDDIEAIEAGQKVDVSLFKAGDKVSVTGVSKGKGFAGTVKRHHFAGGPKTHGQSDRHRAPGSIGSTTTPGRVLKGMRMAGHMGNRRVTVCNLEVLEADPARNLLLLKGAVPGMRNSLLMIRKSKRGK